MSEAMSTHDALVHILVTTCVADRDMATIELKSIRTIVERLPVFAGFDVGRLPEITEDVARLLQHEDGLSEILQRVRLALPERLMETAYALAVEVAAADIVARQEELRFLEMIRDMLEIAPLSAAAIEHSARVRYRKP